MSTNELPPDEDQRLIIRERLDANLLVEAGAGSGKTTELLRRLLALIRSGIARADQIAAVTFTRKAAAELRERFQAELEAAIATGPSDDRPPPSAEERDRLEAALREIDRGFIGTIHSFCARLLRERPIEAGLDPAFREISGPEEARMRAQAWNRHLERLTNEGAGSLADLAAVNLQHHRLYDAFTRVVDNPDVDFAGEQVPRPEVGTLRDRLAEMVDAAEAIFPQRRPEKGWDSLQGKIRSLRRSRWNDGWRDDAVFFDALAQITGSKLKITLIRWDPHREQARALRDRMLEFAGEGSAAEAVVRQWHAHRYGLALRFVEDAARAFERDRQAAGVLSFNDLLLRAARLLRTSRTARTDLARRYRFLLVDEFQDTDPIQAEIVFLLTAADPEMTDWHDAEPRPGSLFVVGDPKQSIYRFRRADIDIYNQVKARIADCGEVVELTTNFRSRPPIETFVNGVFDGLLPAEASASQAAYAPLRVHRAERPPQGVYWYEIAPAGGSADDVAAADARLVASWIEQRIAAGERKAGEFMVLTYRKQWLSVYAAELERREIPFQVAGAGVDIATELDELLHVLRALADPGNPLLTVAALVGLFFGIDHEQLITHRLDHPRADELKEQVFNFTAAEYREPAEDAVPVVRALGQLNAWWRQSRKLPADVVVGNLIDELGLLPYLAAGESGGSNAGALAYTLNAVRQAGIDGDASLQAALDALQEALDVEDAEAPLQPGRRDVVRIMNLHKAKGLEAEVVILAHPTGSSPHGAESHIERPERGSARGGLLIEERKDYNRTRLAAPADWDAMAAHEQVYMDAEDVRLLYVAATRAREELVIGYCAKSEKKSPWKPFYGHRDALCEHLEMPSTDADEPERLEVEAAEIEAEADRLAAVRAQRAAPSYEITSVTKLVKHDASIFAVDAGGLGRAWGNAVHQALEAAGQADESDAVRAACRAALLDNDLGVDADGEPEDLEEIVTLVERVRASDTWQRALSARSRLVEAPFAIADGARGAIVEGVIDLAFAEDDGWVIVDYKTDVVDDGANLEERRTQYRAQVDTYAEYFEAISGETVKERQILWVGMGLDAEVW